MFGEMVGIVGQVFKNDLFRNLSNEIFDQLRLKPASLSSDFSLRLGFVYTANLTGRKRLKLQYGAISHPVNYVLR